MAFDGLKIPDSSWLLNSKVQSLPGAAMNGLEQASQMKDLFAKSNLDQIQLDQAQRTQQAQQAKDALIQQFPQTPQGQQQVASGLAQQGFGEEAITHQRWAQDWDRHNKEYREKDRLAAKERMSASARFIKKLGPTERMQAWQTMKSEMQADGYDISDMPPQPTDDVLNAAEKATMTQKEVEAVRGDDEQLAELKRWHDLQLKMSKNKAGGSGLTTAWTDEGLVVVDKPNSTYTPATAGGVQAQQRPHDVPPQINLAIANNMDRINKIDEAIAKLDDYHKTFKKSPTGLIKGTLGAYSSGSTILNKVDPKGVEARAAVADVGSGEIHDRTGAAMSVHESTRLKPFVPEGTDDYEPARKKLLRFKKFLTDNNIVMKSTYPGAGPKSAGAQGSWAPNSSQPAQPAGQIWSRVPPKK